MRFLTNGICLAAVTGLLYAGAAFAQPNITTAVVASGKATDVVAGMRTSNTGAAFTNCQINGSDTTCAVANSNTTSKKIGNILCLPSASATTQITSRCQGLLNASSGDCDKNSANGQCKSGTSTIAPACNYTTSSNDDTTANWVWDLEAVSDTSWKIDCMQAGFVGASQK
jgi:hypothetical protein